MVFFGEGGGFRVSKYPSFLVSKFPSFQGGMEGGREGGTMRGLGTDLVISGPMRGLKETASHGANRQTDGHGDSMTESAQWGRFSEKPL